MKLLKKKQPKKKFRLKLMSLLKEKQGRPSSQISFQSCVPHLRRRVGKRNHTWRKSGRSRSGICLIGPDHMPGFQRIPPHWHTSGCFDIFKCTKSAHRPSPQSWQRCIYTCHFWDTGIICLRIALPHADEDDQHPFPQQSAGSGTDVPPDVLQCICS